MKLDTKTLLHRISMAQKAARRTSDEEHATIAALNDTEKWLSDAISAVSDLRCEMRAQTKKSGEVGA